MIIISERKQKKIQKLWKEGWSVGAICNKVNVGKGTVYKYTSTTPEKRRPKDYLPLALRKRIKKDGLKK